MVEADGEFAAARQVPQRRGLALRIDIDDRPVIIHGPIIRPDRARLETQPLTDAPPELIVIHWSGSLVDAAECTHQAQCHTAQGGAVRRFTSAGSERCARHATTTL